MSRSPSKHVFSKDKLGVASHSDRVYVQNWGELPFSAFGEILAVPLQPIVHLHFVYGVNSGIAISSGINGGTVTGISGMCSVDTTTATDSEAWMMSKHAMRYIPGQGVNARFTARFEHNSSESGYALAGCLNEDKENALMFGCSGSTFGIFHRKFNIDHFIPQAEWNGTDKFDGSTDETILDPTKGNVFTIQYQWLGFGDIKFGIEEPETGDFKTVHTIQYANANEVPSLSNPAMHMAMWGKNNGSATATQIRGASMAAFAEGLSTRVSQAFHTSASGSATLITAAKFNVLTLKNNITFNGVESENQLFLEHISVINESNKGVAIKLIHGSELTAPTFNDVDSNRSSASVDIVGTAPTEPSGNLAFAFGVQAASEGDHNLTDFGMAIAHGETITISAEKIGAGSSALVTAFLRWREEN